MNKILLLLIPAVLLSPLHASEGDISILNYGENLSVVQYEGRNGLRSNCVALQSYKGVVIINTFSDLGATAALLNVARDRFEEKITYVFNTNPTFERAGGNQIFRTYTIIAHHRARDILQEVFEDREDDIEKLNKSRANLIAELERRAGEESEEVDQMRSRVDQLQAAINDAALYSFTLPDSGVYRDNTLDLFDQKVHVRTMPGAVTNADLVLLLEDEKTIVCGDVIVEGTIPIWDPAKGGSLRGLLDATKEILKLKEGYERVIPGYGNPAGFEIVEQQQAFLMDLFSNVQLAIDSGKTPVTILENLSAIYDPERRMQSELKSVIGLAWEELR